MATGFKNVRTIVNRELEGSYNYSGWHKSFTQITASGIGFDCSMSPGNPIPNYYASSPLMAQQLKYSTNGGIRHGSDSPSGSKILRRFMLHTSNVALVPSLYYLMDYLLYYPFIDQSTNDEQMFDNSITLSRYTNGEGVRIMAVIVAPGSGAANVYFQVKYTNSQGVSGRMTTPVALSSQTIVGTIATTNSSNSTNGAHFLPLQDGDTGVTLLESVTFTGTTDVGLITLVLVKPICSLSLVSDSAPNEVDYLVDFSTMPEIKNDAYLNLMMFPGGSITGTRLQGSIETIWI